MNTLELYDTITSNLDSNLDSNIHNTHMYLYTSYVLDIQRNENILNILDSLKFNLHTHIVLN
jgi:hypothetical protein